MSQLNAMRYAGYSDWRLPTPEELEGLLDSSVPVPGPRIPRSAFPGAKAGRYWTGTAYAPDSSKAWAVDFAVGESGPQDKAQRLYFRAVRGGQP